VFRCAKIELDDFCEGRRRRIEPTRFDLADGMPSNECSGYQSGVWKGPDGRLWFATMNGVAVIDPANLPKNPVTPPVVIETVAADGRRRDPVGGRVTVPPGTLLTEFTFTALSFVAPERNRFRCRLVGYEDEFREVGTARSAAYTRLRPGSYTLRVTAANSDGLWNDTGATLAVTVEPFLWETLPFRGAGAALGVLVLGLGIRWFSQRRLRLQVAALERDQAVNRERARIARNMHDDVGASLTQIGLLSELARRQLPDPAGTASRLDELGNLSCEVVRNLDAMVWTVDPEHDTVAGLVEYIAGFAQEYVAPAGWACRLDLPPRLPDDPVAAATRHHVLLLVKEALNNALKHSGATEVTFRAAVEGRTLRLELADNGRGFDPATSGRFSDGLGNMRDRARLAGGRCTITSTPGTGTKITVELPLD
jgi:signal transduction histidine kinase